MSFQLLAHTFSHTLAVSIAVSWYSELSDRICSILASAALCFETTYLIRTLLNSGSVKGLLYFLSRIHKVELLANFPFTVTESYLVLS